MRLLRVLVPAAALAIALLAPPGAPVRADDAATVADVPTGSLNRFILEVQREYPIDGSFQYHWPKSGGWEGATQDVVYDGRRLARGDPQRRSYCCGLTFEVYVRALLRASGGKPVAGVTADDLHEARLRFFGDSKTGERRRLVQHALESMKLGRAVDHDDARAGDFVQLWRASGSGHQAVFVNWLYRDGKRAGLTYWSSQPSSRGIGYVSERFADGVTEAEVFIGRADWPVRRS